MLFPFWIDMAVPIFMIVSGYVNALSYNRHDVSTWGQAYAWRRIVKSTIRLTAPFLIAYLVEVLRLLMGHSQMSAAHLVGMFLTGGIGPGSYYYPVMLEFVILFPILYFIMKRHPLRGIIICAALNLAFEIGKNMIGMSPEVYRLLICRYILAISVGVFIYIYNGKYSMKLISLSLAVGISYQIATCYMGYKPIIFTQWTDTSMVSILYIAPVFLFLWKKFRYAKWRGGHILEQCGRASFEIFLTQMVFYAFANGILDKHIGSPMIHLIINIIVCMSIGYIFYRIEWPVTKKIIANVTK